MMRFLPVIFCFALSVFVHAEERIVMGKITFLAGGSVYTSLGRESGVQDSTLLFIAADKETTATLKVFAVSSKSSACRIISATRPPSIGDDVAGKVQVVVERKLLSDSLSVVSVSGSDTFQRAATPYLPPIEKDFVQLQGRVSAQYFTSLYDNSAYNIAQPGVVVNLRGVLRDAPVKFDVYANLRTLSLSGASPFSSKAINQSRIYGLSVSYDDGDNVFSVGRIIPAFAPSVGYIDGVLASTRVGDFTVGTTFGFQPDFSLRGVSSIYKKFALFGQYTTPDRLSLSVSAAYARTYFQSTLDREAASILATASIAQDLFIYANTEVDLRKKQGTSFILSPKLTSAYVNLNYRITNSFSVGLGADASRPYYSFESVRLVPDSLLFDELRSGMSVSFNWFIPGGISLYNTYTPRNSDNAAFGRDYSNYSSLSFNDLFSTGLNLRSNFNLNANQYTTATGYGVSLQRTFEQLVDLTVRFQRYGYTVKQTDQKNKSTTLGADVMVFITNALSFIATYDRLDGYGTVSNSVFAEISVRF